MHGSHTNAIVMRRPDGSPMTRQEVIIRRRGAFKWLPALFSNDLVHGSWWFTIGSFATALFAIYPLVQKYMHLYDQHDDLLPATDYDVTWALLIISGVFFTFGSLAFVHGFEEPPKQALFHWFKHAQTDELLGAWMFLFATIPAVPYMFVFFTIEPSAFYFFGLVGAIVCVLGNCLFVKGCYPDDKKHENYVLPMFLWMFGAQMWVVKHLANDWLAGCWIFLIANAVMTFGSLIMLFIAMGVGNPEQIFIWVSGTVSSLLFLIGSLYFVSGSYPHATQFYYTTDRGQADTAPQEVYANEVGLAVLAAARLQEQKDLKGPTTVNPIHSTVGYGGGGGTKDYSLAPSVNVKRPPPPQAPTVVSPMKTAPTAAVSDNEAASKTSTTEGAYNPLHHTTDGGGHEHDIESGGAKTVAIQPTQIQQQPPPPAAAATKLQTEQQQIQQVPPQKGKVASSPPPVKPQKGQKAQKQAKSPKNKGGKYSKLDSTDDDGYAGEGASSETASVPAAPPVPVPVESGPRKVAANLFGAVDEDDDDDGDDDDDDGDDKESSVPAAAAGVKNIYKPSSSSTSPAAATAAAAVVKGNRKGRVNRHHLAPTHNVDPISGEVLYTHIQDEEDAIRQTRMLAKVLPAVHLRAVSELNDACKADIEAHRLLAEEQEKRARACSDTAEETETADGDETLSF